MVLEDVVAEKVSVERAKNTYGVIINPATKIVDSGATKTLREQMAR